MTSRKTSGTPPCAAHCARLELTPARAWAIAWTVWLGLASAAILAASALSLPVRLGVLCVLLSYGVFWVRRTVWLRGARALRAVEWGEGEFRVEIGATRRRLPAIPGAGPYRYGNRLWILRFETPEGRFTAVVDGTLLPAGAVRRLARCLGTCRGGEPVTIPPKV